MTRSSDDRASAQIYRSSCAEWPRARSSRTRRPARVSVAVSTRRFPGEGRARDPSGSLRPLDHGLHALRRDVADARQFGGGHVGAFVQRIQHADLRERDAFLLDRRLQQRTKAGEQALHADGKFPLFRVPVFPVLFSHRCQPADTLYQHTDMPDMHQAEWKPKHNPWLIALTVTLATFMEVLDTSIANVALPHIAGSVGASQDEATWGVDQLPGCFRRHPAHLRLDLEPHRPQALLHDVRGHVYRVFAAVRAGADTAAAHRRAHPAGARRRRPGAQRAGHPGRHLSH